ncbi:MAG: tetratricopeptide repeat protein [Desulfovibrio sp.]
MQKTLIITTILLAAFLTACAPKSQNKMTFDELAYGDDISRFTTKQHEHLADSYASRKQPEMAFVHYNKALEADPKNVDLLIKKGSLLAREGASEQALDTFRQVLNIDKTNAQASEGAGIVLFNAGLDTEATSHLKQALATNPKLWRSSSTLGVIYGREGNTADAAKMFDAALDTAPFQERPEILNNIGVLYMAEKKYLRASLSFQEALSQGAMSPIICNNLGLALVQLNRLPEALHAFQTAGDEAKAHNNIGYVLMKNGRAAESIPYFERALELSPTFYALAGENLRHARMIERISSTPNSSTPNTPSLTPTPEWRNPDAPAASSDAAGTSPLLRSEQKTELESGLPKQVTFTIEPEQPKAEPIASPIVESVKVDQNSEQNPVQKTEQKQIKQTDTMKPNKNTTVAEAPLAYGLSAGSWKSPEKAEKYCNTLERKGFTTFIKKVDLKEKGVWYRVLVGNYSSRKEAANERPLAIKALNVDSMMISPLTGRYNPQTS